MSSPSLREFWRSTPAASATFPPDGYARLGERTRRYLDHAIAAGAPLANAVRLRMHGEIKLDRWLPFRAEQVIRRDRGMIWRATARVFGISVSGYDRLVDGEGEMRWKLMGILPVIRASGPDINRSAAGRMMCEAVWLPSILCAPEVRWTEAEGHALSARLAVPPETGDLQLDVAASGGLRSVALSRWGNPGDTPFHYVPFGGMVEEEATFHGYTIPRRLRIGWHFDSERFAEEGEFFRVSVDEAVYR